MTFPDLKPVSILLTFDQQLFLTVLKLKLDQVSLHSYQKKKKIPSLQNSTLFHKESFQNNFPFSSLYVASAFSKKKKKSQTVRARKDLQSSSPTPSLGLWGKQSPEKGRDFLQAPKNDRTEDTDSSLQYTVPSDDALRVPSIAVTPDQTCS